MTSAEMPPTGPVDLRIEAHGAAYDFDWRAADGHWHSLMAAADGTILSTKRAGGFVGAVFGLYAHDPEAKANR